MSTPVIQHAFHAGEWAPALNARVDLQKYRSAATLLENFFVDYRGGVSTRFGTKYVLRAKEQATDVRLIKFQASSSVGYILEFGNFYIRFYYQGAPVLEATKAITGATQANPGVITATAHGYAVGDWVLISSVGGMTQLNNRYFVVATVPTADTFTLTDLWGTAVNTTSYSAYTSGGTAARVYTVTSPYAAADLALIKFAQNVSYMVLCHPNYTTQILTIISANNWTLSDIAIGTTIGAPTINASTITGGTGATNYAWVATAVDVFGQESQPSAVRNQAGADITAATKGSVALALSAAIPGAQWYNWYKTQLNYAAAVPAGIGFGYIGFSTTTSFIDQNISPDFSQSPPIVFNPFVGGGSVTSVTVTASGSPYTVVPGVTFGAPAAGGSNATGLAVISLTGNVFTGAGSGYIAGDFVTGPHGVVVRIDTVGGGGAVTTYTVVSNGSVTGVGTAVFAGSYVFGSGTIHGLGANFTLTLAFGVTSVIISYPGSGYASAPAVTFSSGTATATSTISAAATPPGNPSVPAFFGQRLILAAPNGAPQTLYGSQPGFPFNYNISNPIQADDAFTATIVSTVLNTIKALVSMSRGLIALGDSSAWLINGGSEGAPITPLSITATPQAYAGCSDIPPLVLNYDILYVQQKGSIVRDLTFNFNLSNYVGSDITVLSSHLFFGYTITEWAWAEEPWKVVWVVRSDGTALALTYVKEQEMIGWTHSTTDGEFKSVATVTEEITLSNGNVIKVDAVYFVVERSLNSQTVKYIERMADRFMPSGITDAWCVDAGLRYSGSSTTTITGLEHLATETVVGIANGVAITPKVVSATGTVTLDSAATTATLGLAFTPKFQTLRLDTGEPTIQGKRKKITGVVVRVAEALGLSIGRAGAGGAFSSALVTMKDLVTGNVGSMTNQAVSGLVTDDARTIIDPLWDPYAEVCIQQSNPYPATILGIIPEISMGDS